MSGGRKVAYLDWAGDPGVRKAVGATDELVVVVALTAERMLVEQWLLGLRKRLQLPSRTEFHFAKAPAVVRRGFFASAAVWPFEATALIVSKTVIPSLTSARSGAAVIAAATQELVANFPPERLEGALLIVDAPHSDQPEVVQIAAATRRSLRAAGLKRGIEVRGYPADREAGLQLVDMLAGAVLKREIGEADYLMELGHKVRIVRYRPKQDRP